MNMAAVHDVLWAEGIVYFHLEKSKETSVCCLQLPDGRLLKICSWTFFFKVQGVWMRENKHKEHGNFLLGIKGIFFSRRTVKHWNKLFREVVNYPLLSMVKILLDRL